MPGGKDFRRDQRQQQRVQTKWANRNSRLYRLELEARQRAEQEARRRAEQERLRAEREAERLRQQIRLQRQQRRVQDRLQRQTQRDNLERQAQQAEALRRQLAEQAQRQHEQNNTDVLVLYPLLNAGLPLLRARCLALENRLNRIVQLLTGSAAVELVTLRANLLAIQGVRAHCGTNHPLCVAQYQRITTCRITVIEITTAQVLLFLQGHDVTYQADLVNVTAIDVHLTAAELTYQNDLLLMRTYPNLGLTFTAIHDARGPIAMLTQQQLVKLNTKLAGHTVQSWARVRMPNTRPNFSGTFLLIPHTLSYFPCQPSGEVFHDWIWDYAGHGQTAAEMRQMLDPGSHTRRFIDIDETQQGNGNWLLTGRNVTLRIILSSDRQVLITFYHRP